MVSGPDSAAPYWLRRSLGLGTGAGRAKKFRASKASLRRNSKTLPWNSLFPDFVETDTTPAPRPNSAEKVPASTLNSRTDSTDGVTMTVLKVYSLLSIPSTSQAFELAWWPRALKFEAPRGLKVLAPDRPFFDHLPHVRGVLLDQGSQGVDVRGLGQGADLEGHVHAGPLVHLEHHPAPEVLLESLEVHGDLVGPGDQEGRHVRAAGVGLVGGGGALPLLRDGDHRPRHLRSGRVLDRPEDAAGRDLGDGWPGQQQEESGDERPARDRACFHGDPPGLAPRPAKRSGSGGEAIVTLRDVRA